MKWRADADTQVGSVWIPATEVTARAVVAALSFTAAGVLTVVGMFTTDPFVASVLFNLAAGCTLVGTCASLIYRSVMVTLGVAGGLVAFFVLILVLEIVRPLQDFTGFVSSAGIIAAVLSLSATPNNIWRP